MGTRACAAGFSCPWRTTGQPFTSWFCLTATMRLSNWRSSTDRWRSTQTSSVSSYLETHFDSSGLNVDADGWWLMLSRSWGHAGGLPEHRSLLCWREETLAGWEVLPEMWPVQQSMNQWFYLLCHNYTVTFLHFLFLPTTFSGSKSFSQVFQHWRQQGSGLGYRDSESPKISLLYFNLPCVYYSDAHYRWVRPRTTLWPISW